jgi:putative spermidine/putrescine transport system permease protein
MADAAAGPDQVTGATPDNALRNADRAAGPVLAADGTPLKRSLNRALRREKLRALALIAPLLIFVLVSFIAPIADMLFRSVENQIVTDTLPRTVQALDDWDYESGEAPGEDVFKALFRDMAIAVEIKSHTRLGQRLNYENNGISSLFRKSGRGIGDIGERYADAFTDYDKTWEEAETWTALMASPDWLDAMSVWREDGGAMPSFELANGIAELLPGTADLYSAWANFVQTEEGDDPTEKEPWEAVFFALYEDIAGGTDLSGYTGPEVDRLKDAAAAVETWQSGEAPEAPDAAEESGGGNGARNQSPLAALVGQRPGASYSGADAFSPGPIKDQFLEIDRDWGDPEVWGTIQTFSPDYTPGYFLAAVDLQETPTGIAPQPDDQQIYILLFKRTLYMSLVIMGSCVLLGYPIAYLLASLPLRTSNVLLILVLLPFWTSLLVRTSAWKVLLQQQGVINDILVWMGLVSDAGRLVMINNQTGTIIAMTHILLPFMILPLYSVMKTIPPSYVRAAKSLGATNWTAFWRVYFPQSVPGIGAGCILVFILAIGYYITPELVGGTTGTFISNRIAYHISSSLNWGLAAALGTILLVVVLALYWIYDRIVGIDNVSLG